MPACARLARYKTLPPEARKRHTDGRTTFLEPESHTRPSPSWPSWPSIVVQSRWSLVACVRVVPMRLVHTNGFTGRPRRHPHTHIHKLTCTRQHTHTQTQANPLTCRCSDRTPAGLQRAEDNGHNTTDTTQTNKQQSTLTQWPCVCVSVSI